MVATGSCLKRHLHFPMLRACLHALNRQTKILRQFQICVIPIPKVISDNHLKGKIQQWDRAYAKWFNCQLLYFTVADGVTLSLTFTSLAKYLRKHYLFTETVEKLNATISPRIENVAGLPMHSWSSDYCCWQQYPHWKVTRNNWHLWWFLSENIPPCLSFLSFFCVTYDNWGQSKIK